MAALSIGAVVSSSVVRKLKLSTLIVVESSVTSRVLTPNISYSIFPGGSNIADLVISGAEIDRAKEENKALMKSLRYDIEKTYYDLKNAINDHEYAKVSLNASSEREKITEVKYLNGLADYDEWYRIENSYIQARKNLLNSKKNAYLAEAEWYKLIGGWVK